jgi:hypothetical protein
MSNVDKKIVIHTVDALCGAGKTYQALEWAMQKAEKGEKICFVQPTIALIDQSYNDVMKRKGNRCFSVERFHSGVDSGEDDSIRRQVIDRFKYAYDDFGCIVFISHATFLTLPYFHDRRSWILICDEIPQVVDAVERNISLTHSLFTKSIETEERDQLYYRLRAVRVRNQKDSLSNIAVNQNKDDVYKVFKPIAEAIVASNRQVFIKKENWHRIVSNTSSASRHKFTAHVVLGWWVFKEFKQVILMGAMIKESLLYKLWFHKVEFAEMSDIQQKLRYTKHEVNGSLTIKYMTDGAWTKNYFSQATDGSDTVFACLEAAISREFDGREFLYVANNSIDGLFKIHGASAKRLPSFAHGINTYQKYDNVAFMSALNPIPATFGFLSLNGVSDTELTCAITNQTCYQAVLRCSLRDPDRCSDKVVIVPSKDTAEWLAQYFTNVTVEQLPELPQLPMKKATGRPKTNAAVAAIHRKRKERKQKLIKQVLELSENQELLKMREKCHENTIESSISVTESSNFESKITLQCFKTKFDAPDINLVLEAGSEIDLQEILKDFWNRTISNKTDNFLIAPSVFGYQLNDQGQRSRELSNVKSAWGIWVDVDGGDMTPDELKSIFPELRMWIFNTFSGDGRYRVVIPTNLHLTAAAYKDIHKSILATVERSDAQFTSSDKPKDGYRLHGLDKSKMHAASLFYAPSQAKAGSKSFFEVRDGKPLDVLKWLRLPVHGDLSEVDSTTSSVVTAQSSASSTYSSEIQRFVSEYKCVPAGSGQRNGAFYALARKLSGLGLSNEQIEVELTHADYDGSRRKKRAIKGVIKSLGQSRRRRAMAYGNASLDVQ